MVLGIMNKAFHWSKAIVGKACVILVSILAPIVQPCCAEGIQKRQYYGIESTRRKPIITVGSTSKPEEMKTWDHRPL